MVKQQWQVVLPDEQATRTLGFKLGQLLPAGSVLLLNGDLGSGKTTLVQGVGQGLGITDPIVSPTFTLISEYLEGRVPLYHLDLYRLQPEEVEELYLETYWDGLEFPLGVVAIEWAERLERYPLEYIRLCLTIADSGRQVNFQATGEQHQQILQQFLVV